MSPFYYPWCTEYSDLDLSKLPNLSLPLNHSVETHVAEPVPELLGQSFAFSQVSSEVESPFLDSCYPVSTLTIFALGLERGGLTFNYYLQITFQDYCFFSESNVLEW